MENERNNVRRSHPDIGVLTKQGMTQRNARNRVDRELRSPELVRFGNCSITSMAAQTLNVVDMDCRVRGNRHHSNSTLRLNCNTCMLYNSNLVNQYPLTYTTLSTDEQLLNQPRQIREAQHQPIAVAEGCCVWPWRLLRENNQQESS